MRNMWRKWLGCGLIAAGLAAACGPAAAEDDVIRVTKGIEVTREVYSNPKLYIQSISGDEAMNRALRSFLSASGWFDLVDNQAAARFVLRAAAQGGRCQVQLFESGAPVFDKTFNYPAQAPRQGAMAAVDALIQTVFGKAFNVKGVCSSKLAFCVETAPGKIDIFLCDIDGGNASRLTEFNGMVVEPSWHPDGKSLIYTRYNQSNTSILQTTLNPVRTRNLGTYNGTNVGASVSPDGKHLAMVMSKDRQVDLYLRGLEGGQPQRLTQNKEVEASPSWSPDGKQLCFTSGDYAGGRIYTLRPGSDRRLLPGQKGDSVKPNWSRDGKVVYSTKVNGRYVLAVSDPAASAQTKAFAYNQNQDGQVMKSNPGGSWESASWAPDNRHLICSRTSGSDSVLAVVDTWTGRYRELQPVRGKLLMPSWSPLLR